MSIDKDQVEDWINHPVTDYIKTFKLKELELATVALVNRAKEPYDNKDMSYVLTQIAHTDKTLDDVFNQIPELLLKGESLYE